MNPITYATDGDYLEVRGFHAARDCVIQKLGKCLYNWSQFIDRRYLDAHSIPLDPHTITQLDSSAQAIDDIFEKLSNFYFTGKKANWNRLIVCNSAKRVEAIAVVNWTGSEIELVEIATRPHNLKCISHVEQSVRGAGTAVIILLVNEAFRLQIPIKVVSTEEAFSFFARFGFEPDNDCSAFTYKLTLEKIAALVKEESDASIF